MPRGLGCQVRPVVWLQVRKRLAVPVLADKMEEASPRMRLVRVQEPILKRLSVDMPLP